MRNLLSQKKIYRGWGMKYLSHEMDITEDILQQYELPGELEFDIERYLNQGGLLGVFTYYLIYLRTGDESLAKTTAMLPQRIFVMSSLHDDAVDNAQQRGDEIKQYLNFRTTIGDLFYTDAIELIEEFPEDFDNEPIIEKIREIGIGQLNEEDDTKDLFVEEASERVDERGTVWGELAVTPSEAAGYYSDEELDYLRTFMGNFLYVLTLVDDVEDIPEDYENNVVNIPLIMLDLDPDSYTKDEAIRMFLDSNVPTELRELLEERQSDMENAVKQFYRASGYSQTELLKVWNEALTWYIESVCTVSLDQIVPPSKREIVSKELAGDAEQRREFIVNEVLNYMPARTASLEEFAARASTLPQEELTSAVVSAMHVKTLVEGVMTTDIDDAINKLAAEVPR
jgi:hypothetical protein